MGFKNIFKSKIIIIVKETFIAGRMAQLVECLPSKCETLISNPQSVPQKIIIILF
jgi:heterodisulfide reductase subunit A-like polyferredoxin